MNNYHCAECGFSEADVNGENCGYCDSAKAEYFTCSSCGHSEMGANGECIYCCPYASEAQE